MIAANAAHPLRRVKPLPLLSTTITSKSRRVCRPRDSRHSRSLESAARVGITTVTRKSGNPQFYQCASRARQPHMTSPESLPGFARRVFIELRDQLPGRFRDLRPAAENLLAGPALPVERLVVVEVVPQRRAIQGSARESAPGARPREYLRVHQRIGLRGGVPAHWSDGRRRVRAYSEFAGGQLLHPSLIHDEQNHVARRKADLDSEASAFNSDCGRRAPALSVRVSTHAE